MFWGSRIHWTTKHISFDDGSQFRDTLVEICEIYDTESQKTEKSTTEGSVQEKDIMNSTDVLSENFEQATQISRKNLYKAWLFKSPMELESLEGVDNFNPVFGGFLSLRSSLGPELPRPTLAKRALAALTARKAIAEALAKTQLDRALKHQ